MFICSAQCFGRRYILFAAKLLTIYKIANFVTVCDVELLLAITKNLLPLTYFSRIDP